MKKQIDVFTDILDENEVTAQKINASLTAQKIFALNIMGSPGCGKTTFLEKTLAALKTEYRFAIIEGDLYTDKDARRILAHGVPAVQINTAGGCHLNAAMVETALNELDAANLDILIVENVGNLVCPAEFNVGEHAKIVLLSVTEGEDKPQKYPLAFREAEVAVITKADLLPYTDFDLEAATADILGINPEIKLITLSCKSGADFDLWLTWLRERLQSFCR